MSDELRVISHHFGGGALALAAAGGSSPWHQRRPVGADAWRTHAARVASGVNAGWAVRLAPALGDGARLLAAVADGGVVVTTGQQPGLFGGPLYTLNKALSALELARSIEAATGMPARAVFWAATDDADFAEARATWTRTPGGARELTLERDPTEGVPMAEVPLGDVSSLLDVLEGAARSAPSCSHLELLRRACGTGATVGSAFVDLLRGILEPMGMPVIDASHPAMLAEEDGMLRLALTRASVTEEALRERDEQLRASGLEPQVPLVSGLSLVFDRTGSGRKRRIPLSEANGRGLTAPRGGLSPNVLLRPVVERAILPSVAYVAGPGELAYFAQTDPVAVALGAAAPLAVPRWSATVIEPDVSRILDGFGIAWTDVADPHRLERAEVGRRIPRELVAATARLRERLGEEARNVREAVGRSGLGVDARVADGVIAAIAHRLDRLDRRLLAAAKRLEVSTMTAIATAAGALFPGGMRQERALNFVTLLAAHGVSLIAPMRAAAERHANALLNGERVPADT